MCGPLQGCSMCLLCWSQWTLPLCPPNWPKHHPWIFCSSLVFKIPTRFTRAQRALGYRFTQLPAHCSQLWINFQYLQEKSNMNKIYQIFCSKCNLAIHIFQIFNAKYTCFGGINLFKKLLCWLFFTLATGFLRLFRWNRTTRPVLWVNVQCPCSFDDAEMKWSAIPPLSQQWQFDVQWSVWGLCITWEGGNTPWWLEY